MTVKPLAPSEVEETRIDDPDVITAVNTLLQRYFRNGSASFLQKELVSEVMKLKPKNYKSATLFDKHLLDFEDSFRAVGWKVVYDKPAYNETYEASFTFTKK